MDVYRQASEIVRAVREGNGTAKALCLRKEMQKKKQTYAVVCETLRHHDLLQDVLDQAEFFKYYPRANKGFAICMAYDVVLGKGLNTNRDTTAQAIQKSAPYLREAYWHVKKHHVIPPRAHEPFAEDGSNRGGEGDGNQNNGDGGNYSRPHKGAQPRPSGDGDTATQAAELLIPRYARVNTLKIDMESLVERLQRAAEKRGREDGAKPQLQQQKKQHYAKGFRTLPAFTVDPVVPSLLVFPAGTDLHAHPAVRSGQLVLQDRASCLPACVLLEAVEVVRASSIAAPAPLEYIVDACAAPGNKTTHLAALGAPTVKIMAVERDEKRAELLRNRVQSLGASDYVNVVNMDFFQMSSADREATEGILLDPSCSASGVWTRVDVSLMRQRQARAADAKEDGKGEGVAGNTESGAISPEEHGAEFASNADRVMGLARLQRKLLAHALLSFDNCRTVVYSTCSVHEEENECVVRQVLEDARVQARGWTLSSIMPTTWNTRGHKCEGDAFPLDHTIRCDPVADATNGFYVARFDRTV
ncbi:putative RNA methyltransferase [Trypanosoma conorhini]|uniref:Putative RNA methyltransferase n=1 Tax=Trypanosoma conorhini TaxID=83891 RepID=A0A422QC09_9TRYP|nr:putative RNA methyltransferase [Trypanosoma conorhini]RNF27512.1 putative RNA methyltransferase [Trypanosoma conorhini]